jgi:hypothetical protein
VSRRADDGRVPGEVAALAPADELGRAPRHALLRTKPRPQRDLHHPAPLAARLSPRRRRRGPAHPPHALPVRAYGPATPQHFARWLSIPLRRAVELFDELVGELEYVLLDGEPGWTVAGDTGTPQQPYRGIRLLPYFDAFVVAGQPRERLSPGAAAARALTPSGQAGNDPVLLVDGVVGGVWHQRRSGRKLAITVEALRELTTTQTSAARRRGRTGGRRHGRRADADSGHRDGGPARLSIKDVVARPRTGREALRAPREGVVLEL